MRIAHPSIFALTHSLSYFRSSSTSSLLKTLTTLAFNMASEDLATTLDAASASVDDEKYGFNRPDMYKENLSGTVDAYDRHVFLSYKSPEDWAAKLEASETDLLPKLLSSAIKARKDDIVVKTKVTIIEGREGTEFLDGDVLIFPEMIKYRGLKDSEVDSFVDDVLVNSKPWASGVQEVLTGSHVFVCAHGSRDRRCGVCGPVLIERLNEEIESRGLKDQVFVSPCSHIGGHKYAGNLIIYSPGPDGKITGHWYGYVTPDDVPELLDQHIGKGEIIERLWRGKMGPSTEEGEKADKEKLPNGDGKKHKKSKHQESSTQSNKEEENVAGCCQGANANGFTCCASLEQNGGNEEKKLKETIEVHEKKVLGKLSGWIGSWEQSDVLAAGAVVGAVATVAVAYSFYRRSA